MNTTYFLNAVAGNLFRTKTSPTLPAQFYIGLSSTGPNAAGENVSEPTAATGYARVKLESLSEPANGVVTNTAVINFNESTTNWGKITHFVIFDTADIGTGHLLMYGELSTPRNVEAATIMTIKSGYLSLSVQNPA